MSRMLKVYAYDEVAKALEANDFDRANNMLKIISASIKQDKKNNTFSEYIELKSNKEKYLFGFCEDNKDENK